MIKKFSRVRVQGSSLIEVITALVIISIAFSTAILVYLNVQRSGFSSRRLTGELAINEVMVTTLQEKRFGSMETSVNDLIVYQDIIPHEASSYLKILKLEARDEHGKLIAERKRLIYAPD